MAKLTAEGKMVIYERSTNRRLERWPVDARAMLATDDYSEDVPPDAVPEPGTTGPDRLPPEERAMIEKGGASKEDRSALELPPARPNVAESGVVVPGLDAERRSRVAERESNEAERTRKSRAGEGGVKASAAEANANVTHSSDAKPGAPVKIPEGRTSTGKKPR